MITLNEIELAKHCIRTALDSGASAARASLSKSTMDACTMLNGEMDKVSHSADSSIYLYIFADGKYGTFSTNRLEKDELEAFVANAIKMVRMLGEDQCRKLPEPERTAKDAVTGLELGLYDNRYGETTTEDRIDNAHKMSIFKAASLETEKFRIISEECEYSESYDDNYIVDSQGFEGRQTESTFSCFSELTIEDCEGNKYSGYWWGSSPYRDEIDLEGCSRSALKKAADQIGPQKRRSGRYRMVVDTNVASRLVSPILNALNASSIQQKMSFLDETVGVKVFPEGMTLMDNARTYGKAGSRLFDSEGVATRDTAVIQNGVVMQYFVNTYMSEKMGMEPTVEDISRPCMLPYIKGNDAVSEKKDVTLKDILRHCDNGIYVTGFNGGNCNPVTGDFSYGVEGFAFSRGKITHPVKEMLITGNLLELWNRLIAVGSDARPGVRWQIGTLAFTDVSFSA